MKRLEIYPSKCEPSVKVVSIEMTNSARGREPVMGVRMVCGGELLRVREAKNQRQTEAEESKIRFRSNKA